MATPAVSPSVPQTRRVTFPVTGMTCAACQSTVERALTRTAGVSAASVNLMLHAATVTYDPARVDVTGLLDAVRDIGYDAAPPQADDLLGAPAARAAAAEGDGGRLWLKAAVSLVAGVLAMVLGMPLMAPDGHADHLRLGRSLHALGGDDAWGRCSRGRPGHLSPAADRGLLGTAGHDRGGHGAGPDGSSTCGRGASGATAAPT